MEEIISSAEISYLAPSLLYNECSGCNIPGIKIVLEETLKPAAGYIRQVYGCAS
jgi:hypothetical protein